MALFSERYGFVKPREMFQIDSLDERTKNRIWNWVDKNFIQLISKKKYSELIDLSNSPTLNHIYCDVYGNTADSVDGMSLGIITLYFKARFFKNPYWEIYDLVELIVEPWIPLLGKLIGTELKKRINNLNRILEQEKVGYRLVNGKVTPIVENAEIDTIENSLKTNHKSVTEHIQCALRSFADRNNPDYRKAIQESFNAVEAWLKNENGNPKSDFRSALQALKDKGKLDIHPVLMNVFNGFYAYMSDEKGLRHALLDQSAKFELEETKCMIVFCSTMINYLEAKKK